MPGGALPRYEHEPTVPNWLSRDEVSVWYYVCAPNLCYGTVSVRVVNRRGLLFPSDRWVLRHQSKKTGRPSPTLVLPVLQWLSAESPSGFIYVNVNVTPGRVRRVNT